MRRRTNIGDRADVDSALEWKTLGLQKPTLRPAQPGEIGIIRERLGFCERDWPRIPENCACQVAEYFPVRQFRLRHHAAIHQVLRRRLVTCSARTIWPCATGHRARQLGGRRGLLVRFPLSAGNTRRPGWVRTGDFEPVAVRDGIGGTGFDAVAAEVFSAATMWMSCLLKGLAEYRRARAEPRIARKRNAPLGWRQR